ncbi:hypothetical protein [Streptomyces albicerus]|uniref:hypothetical protein n=1 Tax=Streptomyces albicerus TaxID=2569859 RepID=UPI001788AA83|nr:hypothetical protein [Streptomyces albicerus]
MADVLAWDDQQRPTRIKSVSPYSFFDSSIHGWRSWADKVEYDIDWRVPERPLLREPAPEAAAHSLQD